MAEIICVSGGFDPLHIGHLEMFRNAASYGELKVILNSDVWLQRKKGFVFLPWQQRAAIIGDLRYVTAVAEVNDADDTVCEALSRIHPRWFANGGDRKPGNTPEKTLCEKLNIEMLWNIGGGKTDSSSDIARKAWVHRLWGKYVTLDEGITYKVKKLVIDPGKAISRQYHNCRKEYWYMAGQKGLVHLGDNIIEITSGAPPVVVEEKTLHKLANPGSEPLVVIEIQSGNYLEEDDVIRVE